VSGPASQPASAPQQTVARVFRVHGAGLRGGRPASVEVRPAPAGTGRAFVVRGVRIPATVDHVVDTRLATTLGRDGARVSMVEHLCAALHAAQVDNVEVLVDGDEVPVLDGSARLWTAALAQAGLRAQGQPRREIRIDREIRVEEGGSVAVLAPAPEFELDIGIDFEHPLIGRQAWRGGLEAFGAELAWARTFGFLKDAEALSAVARGVTLDNTVVYDEAGVMNPGGLRARDEAVRHKALDAVGDAALLGGWLRGRLTAHRAGHAVHLALLRRVRAELGS
jgi:UDP-3-O-[3-hydroxymyristoyl] N-acetylglucosamine deacetylase